MKAFDSLLGDYSVGVLLGSGSYGVVVEGRDRSSERSVAIKYIPNVDEEVEVSKKMIREMYLLQALRHDNIISLLDVQMFDRNVFMVFELCQYDLQKIIYDKSLPVILKTNNDHLYILWQMLRAVQFIHAYNIIHRDIKPANVLVNSDLTVKLCDFGIARVIAGDRSVDVDKNPLTEYVVTRYYRAPEVFLSPRVYGKAQDIWSVACTFGEIQTELPIFPGTNTVNQIQVIIDVLGEPTAKDIDFPMNSRCKRFLLSLKSKNLGLETIFKDSVTFTLLREMLQMNPSHRINADDALKWPFFFSFYAKKQKKRVVDLPPNGYLKFLTGDLRNGDRCRVIGQAVKRIQMFLRKRSQKWRVKDTTETQTPTQTQLQLQETVSTANTSISSIPAYEETDKIESVSEDTSCCGRSHSHANISISIPAVAVSVPRQHQPTGDVSLSRVDTDHPMSPTATTVSNTIAADAGGTIGTRNRSETLFRQPTTVRVSAGRETRGQDRQNHPDRPSIESDDVSLSSCFIGAFGFLAQLISGKQLQGVAGNNQETDLKAALSTPSSSSTEKIDAEYSSEDKTDSDGAESPDGHVDAKSIHSSLVRRGNKFDIE